MGCASSAGTSCKTATGLRLITTKLTFTRDQLERLNTYFRKLVEHELQDNGMFDGKIGSWTDTSGIEVAVEKLVQRLIAGVGNLDPRFSSMFLISSNERRRIKQLKFEYLLRIDALSNPTLNSNVETPVNIEEDASMPGFARLRIRATAAETWAEFLGPAGRLRRDLIKAKVANLLATASKQEPMKYDVEKICCSPGQVVDAEVLDKILKQPEHCRVFYGPASENTNGPETKGHRVAIVEDSGGILLKIQLDDYKTREIQVRLLIGVGTTSWPTLADYPRRIPMHHCEALLHYTAAQSGMYVVASGPYPGARCEDRATLWKIRLPAAEIIMNQHYSNDSVPALTEFVLMEILDQLHERRPLKLPMKYKDCLRVVSRHIVRTIHRWSLERGGPDPLRSWAPDTLSRHVLLALDELVNALKCQNLRCYFHSRCNVMLQCTKGGILHHEDSYISDSRLLETYITVLHQKSISMVPRESHPVDKMETELILRWRRVMTSLPRGTMSGHYGYSPRQIEYLAVLLTEVLRVKDVLLKGCYDNCSFLNLPISTHNWEPIENLLYLLTLVLKQARDQIYVITDRRKRKRDRRKFLKGGKKSNASVYFDRAVEALVEVVKRDRETAYMDLESSVIMAKMFLKWLYFGMDNDNRILGPILRPYLGNLFNCCHENAWHVESWKKRREIYNTEMRSLVMFCKLVTTEEVSPANGIIESLSKGWNWAEQVIKMIERSGNSLKLLFLTEERIVRYNLTFTDNKGLSTYSTWSKARNIRRTNGMIMDVGIRMMTQTDRQNEGIAGHIELRNRSPLTYIVSLSRRQGRQRGPGGLIPALVSLNKFRILQEVAAILPQEERIAMLDMIQRVARESSRRSRRASCPVEASDNTGSPKQRYRMKSESNLLDSPEPPSPTKHKRCIIAERQKQLQNEMMEMQDTLTRGLRTRHRLPAYDSASLTSWTSSIGSGGNRLRRHRTMIWDTVRGTSPIWDTVSTSSSFAKSKSEEMISREESPKWSVVSKPRRKNDEYNNKVDDDRLPSWDLLEATLNEKFLKNDNLQPDSWEMNKDVGIDYLMACNAKKEVY